MDINNMIKNKISDWLKGIDMEEIVDAAIESVLVDYIGDISIELQSRVEEELKNSYCYESEVDRALEEIIKENIN